MEISIPYEDFELFKKEGICSIKSHRDTPLIAYITKDEVCIHDSSTIDFRQVSNYKRDEESMKEYGPNHWIQWVNPQNLTYGTCAGTIFHHEIDSDGNIQDPKTYSIEKVITSTFTTGNLLGLCTSSAEIIIYDLKKQICQTLRLPQTFSTMKDTHFVDPNTIHGIVNNQPFNIQLNSQILHGKESPVPKVVQINDVDMVSYSRHSRYCGMILKDSTIIIGVKGKEDSTTELKYEKSEIIGMSFKDHGDVLMILFRNGKIVLWNSSAGSLTTIHAEILKQCTSFCLDPTDQQLFIVTNDSVHSIEFVKFSSNIGWTPRAVYNLTQNTKIAELNPQSITGEFFPISEAHVVDDDHMLICNKNGFTTIFDNKESKIVKIRVLHACVLMNVIVIVSHSKDMYGYFVSFFDIHCNELGWFPLNHAALSVHVCNNKIVISANTKFSAVKLSYDPIDTRFITDGDRKIYVNIKTTSIVQQIMDCLSTQKSKSICLTVTGEVMNYSTRETLAQNVTKIWYIGKTDMVVLQKPCQFTVLFNGGLFSFYGHACFSDGYLMTANALEFSLGKIEFKQENVIPYLLLPAIENEESYEMAINHFIECPYIHRILADTLDFAMNNQKFSLFFEKVLEFNKDIQGQCYSHYISKSGPSEINEFLDHFLAEAKVVEVFPFMDSPSQSLVLENCNTEIFNKLTANNSEFFAKPVDPFEVLCVSLISRYNICKAVKLMQVFDFEVMKICSQVKVPLDNSSFETVLKQIIVDFNTYSEINVSQILPFFCATLISLNKKTLALAILLATGNSRKASSVLSIDDNLLESVKKVKIENESVMKTISNTLSLV